MQPATAYRPVIFGQANTQGLDPYLVEAIVWQESRGQADAFRWEPLFWQRYMVKQAQFKGLYPPRRYAASYGLMQIMWVVAKELGFEGEPELLFVPSTNLYWGCKKLRSLFDWAAGFSEVPSPVRLQAVLASYNGGKGGNTPGTDLRPDNQQYALRVLATRNALLGVDA